MNKLRCLIIDDEPIARDGIEEYIKDVDFLFLAGKINNPLKAFQLIEEKQVDLIFLDIQMPKMNGIDFIRNLKTPPMVIIITAYPEHALESYSFDVIDYLMKPV